ncbi:MAG: T9SS type A sorting domain-containing protein, partial [Ignavibacteriaceae bacterium]
NYPNPFNSRTTIRYDIPVDQFVTIKVYDITGSELKTLINKNQKAGRYMVNFDGGSFASGIYFCRIITEKFKKVLKMILLK